MQLSGFDANTVDPNDSFDPIPAGWYPAVITESEEKQTKAGDGSYLQARLEVIDGEFKGRILFERLNLNNKNPKAVEIAQRTLSAICHAVSVPTPGDSSELHDKPMMIKLKVKPADGQYDAGNEIKGYKAMGAATSPTKTEAGSSPDASAGASKTPPWKR